MSTSPGVTVDKKPLTLDPVSLTDLQDEGVLMAANDAFFWPFGLALTWDHDHATGRASNLHVRQWSHAEGERERIDVAPDDEVAAARMRRFAAWASARLASMLPSEQGVAIARVRAIWGES